MSPPRLVGDTVAALDRLAALVRAGVSVDVIMTMGEGMMDLKTYSLRLNPEWLDLADELVNDMADTDAARAAGGKWGRAAVLRIACQRGLQELEVEAAGLRKAQAAEARRAVKAAARRARLRKPIEDAP